MNCASCVGRIENALKTVPEVENASVNLTAEMADVNVAAPVDYRALVGAIEDAGYTVPASTLELAIEGMSCASCIGRAERALDCPILADLERPHKADDSKPKRPRRALNGRLK
jgi:Au+-exporting ATPase